MPVDAVGESGHTLASIPQLGFTLITQMIDAHGIFFPLLSVPVNSALVETLISLCLASAGVSFPIGLYECLKAVDFGALFVPSPLTLESHPIFRADHLFPLYRIELVFLFGHLSLEGTEMQLIGVFVLS